MPSSAMAVIKRKLADARKGCHGDIHPYKGQWRCEACLTPLTPCNRRIMRLDSYGD